MTGGKRLEAERLEFLKWAISSMPVIKEGKIEDVEIANTTIPAGKPITVVSMRNAIFMQQKPFDINFDFDFQKQELRYDSGVWMSNSPQELYQLYEPIHFCGPRTLIGGLGLGMFSHLHALHYDTDNVTVELDPRIVQLVKPSIRSGEIIVANLFDFVAQLKAKEFKSAFFDIWQPTGERVWVEQVVPLRRLCRGKINNKKVYCWNEEEMQGQLLLDGYKHFFIDPDSAAKGWVPSMVLSRKGRQIGLPVLYPGTPISDFYQKVEEHKDGRVARMMDIFVHAGTDEWEKEFGELWDKTVAEVKAR